MEQTTTKRDVVNELFKGWKNLEWQIRDHLGLTASYPISDYRHFFWALSKHDLEIGFAGTTGDLESEEGNYYSQRLGLSKFVTRGEDFTAVLMPENGSSSSLHYGIFDNLKLQPKEFDTDS